MIHRPEERDRHISSSYVSNAIAVETSANFLTEVLSATTIPNLPHPLANKIVGTTNSTSSVPESSLPLCRSLHPGLA